MKPTGTNTSEQAPGGRPAYRSARLLDGGGVRKRTLGNEYDKEDKHFGKAGTLPPS